MSVVDISIFVIYMVFMLGVGSYFLGRNKNQEDYYVGGRNIKSWHVGLSVVATDVGGGFSIGLGGLGFTMGLSGSWLLFTGLIGAWMAAVILIPRVYKLASDESFLTYPQLFGFHFNKRTALMAGLISAVGYLGFTSSQILAGAKLTAATFETINFDAALIIMGSIAVVYTVMGGLKAVIYTDTIQWAILMFGLIFIGIPLGYQAVGGISEIRKIVEPDFLALNNVSLVTLFNWAITIIPIWFVGMTLYQRIYACSTMRNAQRAWYLAGFFEWPLMAFMGVLLGLFARVGYEQGLFESVGFMAGSNLDPEMGLPLLLKTILPIGLLGLMMSAYFSAIMSTADSCLMAASGNIVTDILFPGKSISSKTALRVSQVTTLTLGVLAIIIASVMPNVLELMLLSYAFMVSGLFIPTLIALFAKRKSPDAAVAAMLVGGITTLLLEWSDYLLPWGLDPNVGGILSSLFVYHIVSNLSTKKTSTK
jgi:SSS family solute:Na+ symporter